MAVRMTSMLAEQMFETEPPVTAETLAIYHLDMLMMLPLRLHERADLAYASDGRPDAVARCVARFNAELAKRAAK